MSLSHDYDYDDKVLTYLNRFITILAYGILAIATTALYFLVF